jgi:hypothetical protein
MIIVTCITDKHHRGFTDGLLKSVDFFGLNLECICHQGKWEGHRLKDFYINRFLQTVPRSEIILFTDGYDAAFVSGESEILQKFHKINVPVLFSAEVNCYPYPTFSYLHKETVSKFRYLNSGGFMGRAGDLIDLFRRIDHIDTAHKFHVDAMFDWSNQYRWMKAFLFTEELIGLDHSCEIFQTFASDLSIYNEIRLTPNEDDKVLLKENNIKSVLADFIINDRLINKNTNSTPSHLHFNGLFFKNHMFSEVLRPALPWR